MDNNNPCSLKPEPQGSVCSVGEANTETCCPGTKGSRICPEGERYVKNTMSLPPKIAVMSCEGACIKGEIARVAANILAYQLQREAAVRICLGDAATGNSGMLDLMKQAPEVLAVEGCSLHCGNEIMKMRLPAFSSTIIDASRLYTYDKEKVFEIFDMPRSDIEDNARKIAEYVQERYFNNKPNDNPTPCCSGACT